MLADLAALRWLLDGDAAGVRVLGRPLAIACGVRARFGVPCPTCGVTRGVVLAVHGAWADAWSLAPGAAMAVAGMVVLALALIVLGARQLAGHPVSARWIRRPAVLWAGVTVAVWLIGWVAAVIHATGR